MTDQNFQVPPPPPMQAPAPGAVSTTSTPTAPVSPVTPPAQPVSSTQPVTTAPGSTPTAQAAPQTTSAAEKKKEFISDIVPPDLLKIKVVYGILGGVLIVGMFLGSMLFGGSSAPAQNTGLAGVVPNPEINSSMRRCGLTDRSSSCTLYIMNHTPEDKRGEQFLDEAARLTGRSDFQLKLDNNRYLKTRIAPGYFAQIKVSALK